MVDSKYEKEFSLIQDKLSKDSLNAKYLYRKGVILMLSESFEEATNCFKEVITFKKSKNI